MPAVAKAVEGGPRPGLRVRCAFVLLLICQLLLWGAGLGRPLAGRTDFRAFYAAGRMVATGHAREVYRYREIEAVERQTVSVDGPTLPFLYPPFASLLFAPLGLLPYRVAYGVFTLVNVLALWIAAEWIRERSPALSRWPRLLFATGAFCLVPTVMVLEQGQITLLLLLVYLKVERFWLQSRPLLAGCLLALGLVKFQVALPVALLFLLWRQWRVVAGFALGGLGMALVSLVVAGASGLREFTAMTRHVAHDTAMSPAAAHAAYGMQGRDMPNLHGLMTLLLGDGRGMLVVTAVLSLALLLWGWKQKPSPALALVVGMLVSYHMQSYDCALLVMAFAAASVPASMGRYRLFLWASAGLLMLPIAPIFLFFHLSALFIISILGMCYVLSRNDPVMLARI